MFIINVLAILVFVDTVDASTININDGLRITHQTAFISPISKNKRSRLYTKKPDPPSIKPPPLEDAILNGDDVETPPLFDVSSSVDQEAVKEFGVNLSKNLSKTYVVSTCSTSYISIVPISRWLKVGCGTAFLCIEDSVVLTVSGICIRNEIFSSYSGTSF